MDPTFIHTSFLAKLLCNICRFLNVTIQSCMFCTSDFHHLNMKCTRHSSESQTSNTSQNQRCFTLETVFSFKAADCVLQLPQFKDGPWEHACAQALHRMKTDSSSQLPGLHPWQRGSLLHLSPSVAQEWHIVHTCMTMWSQHWPVPLSRVLLIHNFTSKDDCKTIQADIILKWDCTEVVYTTLPHLFVWLCWAQALHASKDIIAIFKATQLRVAISRTAGDVCVTWLVSRACRPLHTYI